MKNNPFNKPRRNAFIRRADSIPMRKLAVVINNMLFRGKVTLLAGPPQTGKGLIETAVAARVSRDASHPSWPDSSPSTSGKVLFFTGNEDDAGDTVIPRLRANGADFTKIHFFENMREFGNIVNSNFGPADVDAIEASITQQNGGGFCLFIVDPIVQAIEGDSTNQSKVQRALNNLAIVARRMNVAILAVTHVVKSAKGRDALGRVAGPLAYIGGPRSVWVTAHNPNRANDPNHFILVNSKSSLTAPAGGWGYRIETTVVADEFGPMETSVIRWGTRYEGWANEILQQIERAPAKKSGALEEAMCFLVNLLQRGPVPFPVVLEKALAAGISEATLTRAKQRLGIFHEKQSGVKHGPSNWFLPDAKDGPSEKMHAA